MRILFILKKNECYGFRAYTRRSAGLWHSTEGIIHSLLKRGVHAKIIEVVDNNDIDREVSSFKPHKVIIEALWVVPEKFPVLQKLHPTVKWYVHLHSHMPFLALEGIAMDWVIRYAEAGVGLIANSPESYEALSVILPKSVLIFLPNVYISHPRSALHDDEARKNKETLNIACFGAVRPLKNHLLQALAAIEFAKIYRKRLRFHINASRVETGGQPVLKNLIQLFDGVENAELVQCPWMEPDEFLEYLQTEIDLGLQVSLSETFNVVCADYITAGLPVVASKEVKWLSRLSQAQDDSLASIISKMNRAYHNRCLIKWNQRLLCKHSKRAQSLWHSFAVGAW